MPSCEQEGKRWVNSQLSFRRYRKRTATLKVGMGAPHIKSITATALSLWLGVLACLLGCASPAKAANPITSRTGVVQCPTGDTDSGDSCCQHGHNPGSSEKNRHHAMSCCPTETALTQKQVSISPALTFAVVAVLPLAEVSASLFHFDRSRANDEIPFQTGRDILQQVHILRI